MEACQEKYVISTIDRIFLNVENGALFLRSGTGSQTPKYGVWGPGSLFRPLRNVS